MLPIIIYILINISYLFTPNWSFKCNSDMYTYNSEYESVCVCASFQLLFTVLWLLWHFSCSWNCFHTETVIKWENCRIPFSFSCHHHLSSNDFPNINPFQLPRSASNHQVCSWLILIRICYLRFKTPSARCVTSKY